MENKEQIFADDLIKKIDNNSFSVVEYYLSKNKFVNIIVNQSTENFEIVFKEIVNFLIDNNLEILTQFLFGNSYYENENKKLAEKYFQTIYWPVTTIKQDNNSWGIIITAIRTEKLETIYKNYKVIGKYFKDEYADYCYLGGLENSPEIISKEESAKSIFQIIKSELEKINMDFKNVVRTWFYLNNLISWYDEFNSVRSNFFEASDVFRNMIPASTGISATNNSNNNLLSAAFAVKPKEDKVKIFSVVSPLQCPAVDYKSSFNRAVEINHPDYKQLIISGTASIDPNGKTAHIDDAYKQISLTMEVVNKILISRNMNWENVTRGIAYFKEIEDIKLFYEYCTSCNIIKMPIAILQADICREDLLFEIEVDAIK